MKKSLLATVAAVALIAGAGFASAAEGAKDQPAIKGSAAAPVKSEPAMKQGADIKAGAAMKGKAETTGAGVESKSELKAGSESNEIKNDNKPRAEKADTKAKTTGAGEKSTMDSKPAADKKAGSESNDIKRDNKAGAETKSNAAAADTKGTAGASANLSADQKTKIRTTVIQSSSAPKVSRSSINFNISVGVVVPRSVHFVAVPTTLVEYYPQYRGQSYFIVDDEIIIVDARTLKIIAVIEV